MFIVNKNCSSINKLSDINNENYTNNIFTISLGEQKYSTSTRLIPLIYFSEQGIVLGAYDFEIKPRPRMIQQIVNSNKRMHNVERDSDYSIQIPPNSKSNSSIKIRVYPEYKDAIMDVNLVNLRHEWY